LFCRFGWKRWPRQRGQECDFAGVALEQHFRDRGRSAEITVDLERRMIIEHVGQRRAAQQFDQAGVRLIAIAETRP
jgi:hypothetical protein